MSALRQEKQNNKNETWISESTKNQEKPVTPSDASRYRDTQEVDTACDRPEQVVINKRRRSDSGANIEAERRIPLIVKTQTAATSSCQVISVPCTWTQRELSDYLRALNGDGQVLTLGGKLLKDP